MTALVRAVLGSQLFKTGDYTSVRFLFAKIRVDECYGDVTTVENKDSFLKGQLFSDAAVYPATVTLYTGGNGGYRFV